MKRGWIVALAGLGVNLSLGTLYSWGVFSSTLREQGWTATESQIPYMMACALFAALMVPGGRIQDKLGPKRILLLAAVLTFVGFVFSGFFLTLIGISLFFGIVFGTAIGFGYAATIPTVIRWFAPSKRGLVSGIVVSGFGLAGIYVAPLTKTLIDRFGLRYTFILFGIVFSLLVLFFRQMISLPPAGYIPSEAAPSITNTTFEKAANTIRRDYIWREMIRTPQFISLWVMFFASTFAGLMMIGNLSNIGQEQVGITATESTAFIMIFAVFNWLGRIAFGVISDRIGRKVTSTMIFSIQFICFSLFAQFSTFSQLAIGTSLVAFCFGGMLANLPATTADYFGVSQFGLNYGLLFTAFGVGGVLGPLFGGLVRDMTGTYHISFWATASLCMVGFILSLMTKAPQQVVVSFPEMMEEWEAEPL